MGWRTVVVNTHSKLTYKNNHLIFKDASRTELIPVSYTHLDVYKRQELVWQVTDSVEKINFGIIGYSVKMENLLLLIQGLKPNVKQ